MRSELQFFMASLDGEEFLSEFKPLLTSIQDEDGCYKRLFIGSSFIQFQPSKVFGNVLTAGRIAFSDNGSEPDSKMAGLYLSG